MVGLLMRAWPPFCVFLAVETRLDAEPIVERRLGDVDVGGVPVFELRFGRAVDQVVVEVEERSDPASDAFRYWP